MNTNVKKPSTKAILFRIAGFVLLFFLLLDFMSVVFVPKRNNDQTGMVSYIAESYKGEPENTLDVVFIGNSDAYRGISPLTLWQHSGVAACVSGKGGQTAAGAYRLLRDMYKTQSPAVVFIETDMLFAPLKERPETGVVEDRVKKYKKFLSENFKDFDDAASSGVAYYFPLLKYHDRWNTLRWSDFTKRQESYAFSGKGFISDFGQQPYNNGFSYMGENDGSIEKMSVRARYYLQKMLRLCQENNSRVVLLQVPSAVSWNYARHNAVQQLADQSNLDFIDMNIENTVFDFDWKTDTKDGGDHLNTFGAQKVTLQLADYIQANFDLPDRRKDAAYAQWSQALAEFQQTLQHEKISL